MGGFKLRSDRFIAFPHRIPPPVRYPGHSSAVPRLHTRRDRSYRIERHASIWAASNSDRTASSRFHIVSLRLSATLGTQVPSLVFIPAALGHIGSNVTPVYGRLQTQIGPLHRVSTSYPSACPLPWALKCRPSSSYPPR